MKFESLLQSATTCYYKERQLSLLKSATSCYLSATAILSQSVIAKCDKCYYNVRQVLQSAMIVTKCDRTLFDWSHRRVKDIVVLPRLNL